MQEESGGCCGLSAVDDARRVADRLGIPYYVMNFKQEFKKNVMDYFTAEYLKGRTPNPCIACNRYVKWEALLERSMAIGADYIATGHYARIEKLPNGRYAIRNSVTAAKDQTYALYNLTQRQLAHTLMPVGDYEKPQIRKLAEEAYLPVAHKADSQDICFVPNGVFFVMVAALVCLMWEPTTGKMRISLPLLYGVRVYATNDNFVTPDGKILGRHKGIIHYTVGQRKGLGISLGERAFVTEIRPQTNEVVIGNRAQACQTVLRANHLNFMAREDIQEEDHVFAKIRYNHKGAYCHVKRTGEDEITCTFEEPQHAITPGQAVVLYEDGYVLGGGTII